jgi:hypothetical protein
MSPAGMTATGTAGFNSKGAFGECINNGTLITTVKIPENDFSLDFWVKRDANASGTLISSDKFSFSANGDGIVQLKSGNTTLLSTASIYYDVWTNVAISRSNGKTMIFINGLQASDDISLSFSGSTALTFNATSGFKIDEIRISSISNRAKRVIPVYQIPVATGNDWNLGNEKNTGDKIKIERVLKQFINREEIKTSIAEIELLEHFSNEIVLECNKPLRLLGINFDNDGNFYSDLTKRIYSVRCSIVHSNPDFDENKGIPFSPTPNNIEKLRIETELIMEIARKIIINTKE